MTEAYPGEITAWSGGTVETNPTTSSVMADTGAIASTGSYRAWVTCGASVAAVWLVQKRNAANSADVSTMGVHTPAAGSEQVFVSFRIDVANERLRVMLHANITGTGSAGIHWERVA